MGMLDRYRKKGGFIQLLNLIETTGKEKAEKFLKMIAEESPVWESEIRKKMISLDRLTGWNQTYLMEVLPHITPNVLGTAIHPFPSEKRAFFLNSLPFKERKQCEEYISTASPSPGEIYSCHVKIINEVRSMVAQGHLKFEKADPDLVIPDGIEESLNSGTPTLSAATMANFESPQMDTQMSTPAASNSHHASASPSPMTMNSASAGSSIATEELTQLRRKVMSLTQENQLLKTQLQTMKEKLDAVRKAAA